MQDRRLQCLSTARQFLAIRNQPFAIRNQPFPLLACDDSLSLEFSFPLFARRLPPGRVSLQRPREGQQGRELGVERRRAFVPPLGDSDTFTQRPKLTGQLLVFRQPGAEIVITG